MTNETSSGYIFLCSDTTEPECLAKSLFGATSANFKPCVDHDTVLFLYNTSSKQLKGLWKAR